MAEIVLDGLEIRSAEAVHDRFAQGLNLPAWYGRNLDALFDCLTELGKPWRTAWAAGGGCWSAFSAGRRRKIPG